MKKRILAMLLALTMMFSMVPVQAFASETEPAEVTQQITETTEAVTEVPQEEPEETTAPVTTEAEPEETMAPAVTEVEPEETTAPQVTEAPVEVVVQKKAVASAAAAPAKVTVTIGTQGVLRLVRKEVTVKDLDSDGLLTFDEAMVAAHKEYYKDGESGYVSLPGSYGLQVGMLWGHGNGNFLNGMFFTNNVTNALNVGESYVKEGDDLYAAALYNDIDFYDWYSYFDKTELTVKAGEEFTLTLNGFPGMTWGDPVSYAVPGATIGTWDEAFTALSGKTTDDSGKVTLSFAEPGTYVVSATGTVFDDMMWMECPIIAPACVVTVEGSAAEPEAPKVLGTVHVIVENTTYTDATAPWSGTLVDTEVALTEDMTMMTAILTALNQAGHIWKGTGGQTAGGWDVTYISEISKDGTTVLAEFDGGNGAGWMGTLNDWFVNLGFEQWKAGKDLLDGDEIRLMYTRDLGVDLGGDPQNKNGFLKGLSASTGTLAPAFAKEEQAYTLTVEEGVTALDITAVAENKQDKVTVAVGGTEYRRGEQVAVADGTQITVTCGSKTYTVEVEMKSGAAPEQPAAPAWPFTISVNGEALEVTDLGTTEECTKMYYTAKKLEVTVPAGTKAVTVNGVVGAVYLYPNHGSQKIASPGSNTEVAVSENAYLCMRDVTEGGWYHVAVKFAPCENHDWTDATCSVPKTCSVCGATEGEVDPDAHNYVDGTCEYCGQSENPAEPPVPFSQAVTVPSNGNSSWGYVSGLTISGTDGSIYETYWASFSNPYVLDVILGQDTDPDAQLTASFTAGGLRKPTINGENTVTLVDGKGTIKVTAKSAVSSFYSDTDWTINFAVDDGSAASRPTYEVILPTGTQGYTVTAHNSESPVIVGRNFSFKLTVDNAYVKTEDFKVLVNGEEITGSGDVYTISDINEAKTVTVEGIRAKTLAEMNVTIIAPAGSTISTGKFYSYFKYDFDEPLEITTLEDGRIQYVAPVPGSQNFLRVQHPDGVTYWDFEGMGAGSRFEITEEMLFIGSSEFTKDTVYHNFEKNVKDKADLYMTVNEKGWLDMGVGDTWNLNIFRNFLSLGNSISNDKVALPDTHYRVIDINGNPSDVVSVTPDAYNSCYAEIKAEKPGTAIILVTYDAVYNNDGEGGKQWSAIWPENTGVIVVTVDQSTGGIATNMTVNEQANAGGKQNIDAEHDILFYTGNKGGSFSFKPESGVTVTVNRSTVGGEMNFSGFTSSGIRTAADGTVTVSGLTTGTHIIKAEKDGKAVYQVIRARQTSFELTHSDGTAVTAGNPAQPGETITVQFHNLVSPLEKLSGVYNANFGFHYNGEDGTAVRTSGGTYGVYVFSGTPALQKFTFTIPSYWNESTYTLSDGTISLGGFGGSAGSHRTTTYIEGKEVNTNASGTVGAVAMLPELIINTAPCGYYSYNVTLPTGEGYTVSGDTMPIPEGDAYTFTVTVDKGYDDTDLVVKANDAVLTAMDGIYTVEDVREDLVITVEGVVKYPEADMNLSTVIYNKADTDTYWGRENYGWVNTVTFGGAEVADCTWDGDTCNVVLTYDTPRDGFVGFAFTAAGRNDSYAGRVTASVNGVGMTAGVPTSVKLVDGTATAELYAQYSSNRYSGTKTFVLTVQETPEDVADTVATVNGLVDAIDLPVELEDEAAVMAAWDAYEALNENQKRMIVNADLLLQAKAQLDTLKAVKLTGGKSVTLKTALTGKVKWSLAEEYEPFASLDTKKVKLTAKKVVELISVYAVATDAEGNTETVRIDIYPAVSQVKILDAQGALVNGKTLPVKVNDGSDGTIVFNAGTYPADAQGAVTWTVTDDNKKIDYVTYEVNGNEILLKPAENVKKGTVTITAAATDGSGKKATVKLNIAVLAENVAITGADTVASGKSITLKAAPTNANATSKAIAWSIVEGEEFASVSSSGKLTAAKDLMDVATVVVRATAKDGSGAYADTEIKVTPLALGVQMYNSGRICSNTKLTHNMTAQDTLTLSARVYPLGKANQAVTWKSSNSKIASVAADGTVTCKKAGKVTITATAADGSKEKATFTLTIQKGVESLTLDNQIIAVKKELNLAKKLQINPTDATKKTVKWEIIGESYGATVSSKGVLNTKKVDVSNGPVVLTISASAQDGWGATPAICTVTVYPATTSKNLVVKNGDAVVGKKDVLTLEAGKELKLTGYCEGAANVYTWKSSSKKVQVVDGVVTATEAAVSSKPYTITCTAADGTGVKVTVKVKVVAPAVSE